MAGPTANPLESRVRQARRRLFTQTLLNRLGLAWGLALLAGIGLVFTVVLPTWG